MSERDSGNPRNSTARRQKRESSTGARPAAAGAGKGASSPRPASRARAAAAEARTNGRPAVERERGPRGWLFPILESAYTKLVPTEEFIT